MCTAPAEMVGQGEVGRVTRRVLCKWHLLGLAVKRTMYNNNLPRNGVFGVNWTVLCNDYGWLLVIVRVHEYDFQVRRIYLGLPHMYV